MRRAVFLDRDAVINRAVVRESKPYPPANLAELEILPGVLEALNSLHSNGWLLIVVTNQHDVARGTTALSDVEAINHHLQRCFINHSSVLHFVLESAIELNAAR